MGRLFADNAIIKHFKYDFSKNVSFKFIVRQVLKRFWHKRFSLAKLVLKEMWANCKYRQNQIPKWIKKSFKITFIVHQGARGTLDKIFADYIILKSSNMTRWGRCFILADILCLYIFHHHYHHYYPCDHHCNCHRWYTLH